MTLIQVVKWACYYISYYTAVYPQILRYVTPNRLTIYKLILTQLSVTTPTTYT